MASSLIRINEATIDDLQTIKGIGPKRAAYIESYRRDIAPIRNTFDLATATGLSLKGAADMSDLIDWTSTESEGSTNLIPVVVTACISLALIFFGFEQITDEPLAAPASYFNFSVALILLGLLAASGDIAIASIRRSPTETSWVFTMASVLAAIGLVSLAILVTLHHTTGFAENLDNTLLGTVNFLLFGFVVLISMYGPAALLRLFISDRFSQRLLIAEFAYSVLILLLPVIAIVSLATMNTSLYLEEIFAIWTVALLSINGFEVSKGESPFVAMLSSLDQGRFRFVNQRQRRVVVHSENLRVFLVLFSVAGVLATTAALILI